MKTPNKVIQIVVHHEKLYALTTHGEIFILFEDEDDMVEDALKIFPNDLQPVTN